MSATVVETTNVVCENEQFIEVIGTLTVLANAHVKDTL